jgi:hypothetical protein
LEKLVLSYTQSDGFTFACEVHECIEYESAEALVCDLEDYLRAKLEGGMFDCGKAEMFEKLELEPRDFFSYKSNAHKTSSWIFNNPPIILSLDDWFENRKIKPEV